MDIKAKLQQDLVAAMKNKDERRVSILRLLRSAIRQQEIDRRKDLSEEEVITILQQAVKKHKDSITAYRQGQRYDLVEQEEYELNIIQSYLPQPLSQDELTAIIEATIRQVGASSMRDIGKVMGSVMAQVKGRADGALVQAIVRAKLGG